MSNTAKASHKLAILIDRRSEIHNQTNDGRRRFVCDPEARSYPTFRTDGAADYYIDCAAAVPELAQVHGDHILALTSCIAQQQIEIAQLRAELRQIQNSLVTTQAAKDVLTEITKLVKNGKSVTNAAITLRSKGKISQRRSAKKDTRTQEEEADLSSDSVAVALHSILSCFTGSACFDSTAVKASISRLKEAEKEQTEIANNSESQVEVKIGIGHLG